MLELKEVRNKKDEKLIRNYKGIDRNQMYIH